MAFAARKAERKQAKARVLLAGPSGSGKTYGALLLAKGLDPKGRIAIIDTENGSADLYADLCNYDVIPFHPPYGPERYVEAIRYCEDEGYDIIIIDSITHEWSGQGGCLELQSAMGGRFQDWAKITPRHQKFIDAILRSPKHIIAAVRTKTNYEVDEKSKKVSKVGTSPVQREGLDYEMTVVFDLTHAHLACASKDRTRLFDGREETITTDTGKRLADWLNSGVEAPVESAPAPVPDARQRCLAMHKELSGRDADAASVIVAKIKDGMTYDDAEAEYAKALSGW